MHTSYVPLLSEVVVPRWPTDVIRYTKRFVLWKGLSSVSCFQGIGYSRKKKRKKKEKKIKSGVNVRWI